MISFLIDYIDMKKFILDEKIPKNIKFGCYVVLLKWSEVWIFVIFSALKGYYQMPKASKYLFAVIFSWKNTKNINIGAFS